MKEGRKPEYSEKPLAVSFSKYHILKPEDSSPKWDSNLHCWQATKADVLTVTPRWADWSLKYTGMLLGRQTTNKHWQLWTIIATYSVQTSVVHLSTQPFIMANTLSSVMNRNVRQFFCWPIQIMRWLNNPGGMSAKNFWSLVFDCLVTVQIFAMLQKLKSVLHHLAIVSWHLGCHFFFCSSQVKWWW